jgi:hypothetical protein
MKLKMSAKLKEDLISSFNKFIEDNKELNKNNLIKVINDVYVRNKEVKAKRPLSAYQIFMKEHYASVQEEEKKKGEVKPGQVLSAIGKLWKLQKGEEGKVKKNKIEIIEEEDEKSEEEEEEKQKEIKEKSSRKPSRKSSDKK